MGGYDDGSEEISSFSWLRGPGLNRRPRSEFYFVGRSAGSQYPIGLFHIEALWMYRRVLDRCFLGGTPFGWVRQNGVVGSILGNTAYFNAYARDRSALLRPWGAS